VKLRITALVGVLAAIVFMAGQGAAASPTAVTQRTGTIAFIRLIKGPGLGLGALFVVRPDGGGLRQLTPEGTKVWSYAWSPDGRLIAYLDQHLSLWLVRPDGSGRRLLVPDSRLRGVALSWSPDGTTIAITTKCRKARCSRLGLYVVAISGRAPVRLPAGNHLDWNGVSWSPGGDEIYYGVGGIWTIRPDGTGRRKISPVGGAGVLSADGSQFVFGVKRYRSFGVVHADGSGYHVVTSHAYTEYGEVWSPTGHRILYGGANGQGIYVIDPDGRNNHRVTRDAPPQAEWPALGWSPTGGSIVYDSGTYKNTDLYVIGVDGRDKVQLTNTPEIDIAPSWVALGASGRL
jgi:Tol biopolymer transport system component